MSSSAGRTRETSFTVMLPLSLTGYSGTGNSRMLSALLAHLPAHKENRFQAQ